MAHKDGSAGSERPPRPALSRGLIVSETLMLVDEQGLAAVSMRAVADRLGVQAMSLYRHVSNREALFDAMVERIVNELGDDPAVHDDAATVGWRQYLHDLAWGVRRYAIAHPHAFPLVSTRPPEAPWVNPPLRSLEWIESMLQSLVSAGFTDEQVLFTYRTFNGFLLGHLLLETSAMVVEDPKPGDGSYQVGDGSGAHDPVDPADPVPATISPTRTTEARESISEAESATELMHATSHRTAADYPVVYRLREGLTENRFVDEFAAGLDVLLNRIAEATGR